MAAFDRQGAGACSLRRETGIASEWVTICPGEHASHLMAPVRLRHFAFWGLITMNKISRLAASLLLALPGLSLAAEALDCAALAISAEAEPAGWSEQCGFVAPTAAAVSPSAVTDTGFTIDVRGDGRPANTLYSFTLNNFPAQAPRGATNPSVFGMDFTPDGGTLYGVTGSTAASNPSTLGTINQSTGAFTAIAALGGVPATQSASGLTIHPVTGEAYLSTFGDAASRLYSLNLATGAATLIGSMSANIFIDIAMNCDGQLYAHSITDDALYAVNPATGASSLIGLHGLPANFAQGMDFDNDTGELYAFIYTGGGTNRFGTFNLATGAFTTLVQDNPLGEFEGAIPTQCAGPVIEVAPTSLGFGDVNVGATSAAQSFTVSNSGNAIGDISSIEFSGPFARAAAPGTCPTASFSLAGGESCTVNAVFQPVAAGAAAGSATVLLGLPPSAVPSGGPAGPSVTLGGNGLAVADIGVSPTSLSFGNVPVGSTSAAQFVTFSNTGGGAGSVDSLLFTGGFARLGGTCGAVPFALNAGQSCTVGIAFTAASTGAVNGTLTANAGATVLTVTLSASGALPPPAFIPVDSPWALALLAILMTLLAGVFVVRRQN